MKVLNGDNMRDAILKMVQEQVEKSVDRCISEEIDRADWDLVELNELVLPVIPLDPITKEDIESIKNAKQLKHRKQPSASSKLLIIKIHKRIVKYEERLLARIHRIHKRKTHTYAYQVLVACRHGSHIAKLPLPACGYARELAAQNKRPDKSQASMVIMEKKA